jgi:hypothetical protein
MTATRNPEDARRITELLAESEQETSAEIEEALYELLDLASRPAPSPSGELAALLQVDDLMRHRWARKHRTGLIVLGVVGALGLGATGAAASNLQFRELAQDTVVTLINQYTPFHVDPPKRPVGGENPGSGTPSTRPTPSTSPGESGQSTSGDSSDGTSGNNQPPTQPGDGTSSDHGQPSQGQTSEGQPSSGDSPDGSSVQNQPAPQSGDGAN